MLDTLTNLVQLLGSPTSWPQFIVLLGLGYLVYLATQNQRGQNKIATNHLHPLPDMVDTLKRIEQKMDTMIEKQDKLIEETAYFKGRINGRS